MQNSGSNLLFLALLSRAISPWQHFLGLIVGLVLMAPPAISQATIGGRSAITRSQMDAPSVLLRLPFHRFYREIQYELRDGRAIYQGDIDLGAIADVRAQSVKNVNVFSAGGLNINFFKPRPFTRYPALNQLLQAQFIPDFAENLDLNRSSVMLVSNKHWPSGRIPFEIKNGDFDQATLDTINDAMNAIEVNTTVTFVTRNGERNFIRFQATTKGNSSRIGMQGGRQKIRLTPTVRENSVIHEISHSLGVYHMQSRADRNQFVCFIPANVITNQLHNFDIHGGDEGAGVFGAYNVGSIMHYPSCAFSSCNLTCPLSSVSANCSTLIARDSNGNCTQAISATLGAGAPPSSDWDAINYLYDPNFNPVTVSTSRTITVNIDQVTTTLGPEENGWGCNDRMDYYGEISVGILADIGEDPYRFEQVYTMLLNKVEGNDIRPDWRQSFIMGPNDRFGLIRIKLIDEDKKGGVGVGACGRNDDAIDISPRAGTTLQLVVEPSENRVHLSESNARMVNGSLVFRSTLNGVAGGLGQQLIFAGTSGTHRARIRVTVNVN